MNLSVCTYIKALVDYAVERGLASEYDRTYLTNRLTDALGLDMYAEPQETVSADLEEILSKIDDYAFGAGLISDNTVTRRDLFDTAIMGILTPAPSVVIEKFRRLAEKSKEAATNYFYALSENSDYIRTYRIRRDVRYKHESAFGTLDITVNLSKPEKTPEEIALARTAPKSEYPLCALCRENEGYAGNLSHPARQNLRMIPVSLNGKDWFMQYSPYVYFNEHCIVLSKSHTPMSVDRATFARELDFAEYLPHYFIGSNADLPIVGGSILSHDHMQGGRYTFAMTKAPVETRLRFDGFDDVDGGIVRWPMSVIRISSKSKRSLVDLAEKILCKWREYSDGKCFIFARTDGEPHNTITSIARVRDGKFELDLVLRNNITTEKYPLGVFHPHPEHHNIKKENIGLIEVMGLAVLPARLKSEMQRLAEFAASGKSPSCDAETEKHAEWFRRFKDNYKFTADNALGILYSEVGNTFVRVLEDCGVYKRDAYGKEGFLRFLDLVGCNVL